MVRISDTDRQRAHAREAPSAGFGERRNPDMELDLDWVLSARANLSAIERRAETLTKRRTVKKQWLAAWLLRAIRFGASSLLGDIERQLEHFATGRYSADFRHPMA